MASSGKKSHSFKNRKIELNVKWSPWQCQIRWTDNMPTGLQQYPILLRWKESNLTCDFVNIFAIGQKIIMIQVALFAIKTNGKTINK